jgi:hypothetical protein
MPKTTASVSHTSSKDDAATIEKIEPQTEQVSGALRDLIFLGRVTSTVEIQGHTFELQTLNIKQQKDIYAELMLGEDPRLTEIKPIVLSRSIISVNGTNLCDLSEDEGVGILDIIGAWQFSLIDRLYTEYESMVEASNNEVGAETVKK